MATIQLKQVKVKTESKDTVTTVASPSAEYVDRSEMLLDQMVMIAWNNKSALHLI